MPVSEVTLDQPKKPKTPRKSKITIRRSESERTPSMIKRPLKITLSETPKARRKTTKVGSSTLSTKKSFNKSTVSKKDSKEQKLPVLLLPKNSIALSVYDDRYSRMSKNSYSSG